MSSDRITRMISSAPDYYQFSQVYNKLQEAPGLEYDSIEARKEDLRLQLYIPTATWGIKYWEEVLEIPIVEEDSYAVRRSRVLARWRGFGNFSAELIKLVTESYSNGETEITVNIPDLKFTVTFVGVHGIPEQLDDLKDVIEEIKHAHLGVIYKFTYLIWDSLDSFNYTWDQLDALNLTWEELSAL